MPGTVCLCLFGGCSTYITHGIEKRARESDEKWRKLEVETRREARYGGRSIAVEKEEANKCPVAEEEKEEKEHNEWKRNMDALIARVVGQRERERGGCLSRVVWREGRWDCAGCRDRSWGEVGTGGVGEEDEDEDVEV